MSQPDASSFATRAAAMMGTPRAVLIPVDARRLLLEAAQLIAALSRRVDALEARHPTTTPKGSQ